MNNVSAKRKSVALLQGNSEPFLHLTSLKDRNASFINDTNKYQHPVYHPVWMQLLHSEKELTENSLLSKLL